MTETAARPAEARPSARRRLLDAAGELFYAEGVHTVGIDRVIERAGVAKASLYSTFGSKDALVRAYLEERHELTRARVETVRERWDTPREQLLGVFVTQGERMSQPDYCGCPFISATSESDADSGAWQASTAHREWFRGYLAGLLRDAGLDEAAAEAVARQLHMIYDGATVSFRLDGNPAAAEIARDLAAALLSTVLPG